MTDTTRQRAAKLLHWTELLTAKQLRALFGLPLPMVPPDPDATRLAFGLLRYAGLATVSPSKKAEGFCTLRAGYAAEIQSLA